MSYRKQPSRPGPGMEMVICTDCNGSGEGHYDGTRCNGCGGGGEVEVEAPIPVELADEEDESDGTEVVYLSGPMTGLPDNNFPAFHATAKLLRSRGLEVRNPAEVGETPGMSWEQYMRKDLLLLAECTTIYLLPGWQNSKGAHLELHIAHRLGMKVVIV